MTGFEDTSTVRNFAWTIRNFVVRRRRGQEKSLFRCSRQGNNTDINTRFGWYSSTVTTATIDSAEEIEGTGATRLDSGWNGATPFPVIQGADCCGRIVAVGDAVGQDLIDARVLIRSCMPLDSPGVRETEWLGSDRNGAFAQFTVVRARDVFPVESTWGDAALATIPCAYGTAENLVSRAGTTAGSVRYWMASSAKRGRVMDIGADEVLERGQDPVEQLGARSIGVVVDNVGGNGFGSMLSMLRLGGAYVTSGAIAGRIVDLYLRKLYLGDLRLLGCTSWGEHVFADVVS